MLDNSDNPNPYYVYAHQNSIPETYDIPISLVNQALYRFPRAENFPDE
jgi:hypothetical protein